MNDITNLRLSKRAEEVAEQLKNTGKFDSAVAAAKFALAYAVKNYYDEFDPASYVVSDSLGTNYNVGSFDNDSTLIQSMSDTDSTFNFLISMIYTQLFNLLCEKADDVYGGRLPVHVRCLIDECAKEMMRIVIPNQDRSDHSPWASFVLPAKAVHENQYGKGLWAKIPADGTTTVTKPVLAGEKDGKNIWKDEKAVVPNKELKSRVEFYKEASRGKQKGGPEL